MSKRNFRKRAFAFVKLLFLSFVGFLLRHATPIKHNKVVLSSFSGHGYTCNPKYILEELISRNVSADYVWLTNSYSNRIPPQVRQIKYESIAAIRELASARVWIDNTRGEKCIRKKDGQFYIQTWHALAGGVKKVERDAETVLSRHYIAIAKADGADTDLMIANNDFSEKLYKSSFWFEGPVLRCGMPRSKPLLNPAPDLAASVKRSLLIDESLKICLYAPTFRGPSSPSSADSYKFDFQATLEALSSRFSGKFIMVTRLHPNLFGMISHSNIDGIVDASRYPDIQELLVATDVLITDYSSVADDFALLFRPCFVYATDKEAYESNDRGFYFSLDERPFPVAEDFESLIKNIATFSEKDYMEGINAFFQRLGVRDDGLGACVVANLVEAVLSEDNLEIEQLIAASKYQNRWQKIERQNY